MTEVLFLTSIQDQGNSRLSKVAEKLRQRRPDIAVRIIDCSQDGSMLTTHKLKFGPAVVIDGRLEYVGIPSIRTLVERLTVLGQREATQAPQAQQTSKPAQSSSSLSRKETG